MLHVQHDLGDHWRCLREIHAAPEWSWPVLVAELIASDKQTVEATRKQVGRARVEHHGDRCCLILAERATWWRWIIHRLADRFG